MILILESVFPKQRPACFTYELFLRLIRPCGTAARLPIQHSGILNGPAFGVTRPEMLHPASSVRFLGPDGDGTKKTKLKFRIS